MALARSKNNFFAAPCGTASTDAGSFDAGLPPLTCSKSINYMGECVLLTGVVAMLVTPVPSRAGHHVRRRPLKMADHALASRIVFADELWQTKFLDLHVAGHVWLCGSVGIVRCRHLPGLYRRFDCAGHSLCHRSRLPRPESVWLHHQERDLSRHGQLPIIGVIGLLVADGDQHIPAVYRDEFCHTGAIGVLIFAGLTAL